MRNMEVNFTRGFEREREKERESNGSSSSSIVKLVSLELLYFYDTLRPLKNYYTTLLLFSNNQLFRDICALRYFGDSSTFFLSLLPSFEQKYIRGE